MWRAVPGYGGLYQCAQDGRVRRVGKTSSNNIRYLKPWQMDDGTELVKINLPDGRVLLRAVRSIVADTWGTAPDIPAGAPDIRRRTPRQNREKAERLLYVKGQRRPVAKVDVAGNVIDVYPSAAAAGKANYLSAGSVRARCRGLRKCPYLPDGCTFVWDDDVDYDGETAEREAAVNPKYGKGLDVEDCVDALPWLDEAIEALRAQEPRVIQAADFMDENGEYVPIPCWKEPKSPTRRAGWAVIVYGKWLADKGVCRYWTGRPTDEQREAAKWE